MLIARHSYRFGPMPLQVPFYRVTKPALAAVMLAAFAWFGFRLWKP